MPMITKPTRFPPSYLNQNVSLLDHIWTNFSRNYIGCAGILCDDITDHCTTFLTLSKQIVLNIDSPEKIEVKFRLVNEENLKKFQRCLSVIDWNILNDLDVNEATLYFLQTIDDIYCRCFPLKIKWFGRKRLCSPWLSAEILRNIKDRSICFNKSKLGQVSDLDYRKIRNSVNSLVRKAKRRYYRNVFDGGISDMRKTWKNIHKIVSSNVSKRNEVLSLNKEGRIISSPDEVAQYFNEHFCSIAHRIDNDLPLSVDDPLSYVRRIDHSFSFDPVTENEISDTFLSLRNTKYGLDSVPVVLVRKCHLILGPPFSLIVNKSFAAGIFPSEFKNAVIVPVFKKGDKLDINNYRPISILPLFSKVIERCVARRLVSFLDEFSILHRNQYGFLKGLSTVDAIIDFSEYIYENLENKNHIVSVFIDYRKAFDTVQHDILLSKLEAYGIRGLPFDWFKSYLHDRKQCVRIGKSCSNRNNITIGIPQGSVLGPILFILYVNELANVSPMMKTILFADDTTVSLSGRNFHGLLGELNDELCKFSSWSLSNRLSLNVEKTGAMIFSNRLADVDLGEAVRLNHTAVDYLDKVKFLGVTLDSKLKYCYHIDNICSKLSKVIGIMYRVKRYLPRNALICLYYSLFYPYLLYGNVLWGGTFDVHLNNIEILQKRVIRIITDSSYLAHTDPLFHQTGILKACDIHKFLLLSYFFKHRDDFPSSNVVYNTRHAHEPLIPYHRLTSTCLLPRDVPRGSHWMWLRARRISFSS